MKFLRVKLVFFALFVVFLFLYQQPGFCSQTKSRLVLISYIDKAKVTPVLPDSPCYKTVFKNALLLLKSATDKHKVIVSKELIKRQKDLEAGFQLVFTPSQSVKNDYFNRVIEFKEIYIPISGRFASGRATIFYANPEYQETNQFVNLTQTKAVETLRQCRQ